VGLVLGLVLAVFGLSSELLSIISFLFSPLTIIAFFVLTIAVLVVVSLMSLVRVELLRGRVLSLEDCLHWRIHGVGVLGWQGILVRVELVCAVLEYFSNGDQRLRVLEKVEVGVGLERGSSFGSGLALLLAVVLQFVRHGRKSNSVRQVWQRVDETTFLSLVVVEGAAIAIFALAMVEPVLAWLRLVVGMHCTKSVLAKSLG
jgi:hypothetical protein